MSGLAGGATSSAVDIVAVVTFVTMWVQLTKPFIEYRWFRAPGQVNSPIHDAVVKFYTFLVALATVLVLLVAPPARTEVFYTVVAVLSAMGLYHSINGGQSQSPVIDPALVRQIEAVLEARLAGASAGPAQREPGP